MSDIEFEDPPPQYRGGGGRPACHLPEAAELRGKPGRWAVLCVRPSRNKASCMAHQIRTGGLMAFGPAGAFQAMARTVDVRQDDGSRLREFRVYARFVGETKADG